MAIWAAAETYPWRAYTHELPVHHLSRSCQHGVVAQTLIAFFDPAESPSQLESPESAGVAAAPGTHFTATVYAAWVVQARTRPNAGS